MSSFTSELKRKKRNVVEKGSSFPLKRRNTKDTRKSHKETPFSCKFHEKKEVFYFCSRKEIIFGVSSSQQKLHQTHFLSK